MREFFGVRVEDARFPNLTSKIDSRKVARALRRSMLKTKSRKRSNPSRFAALF